MKFFGFTILAAAVISSVIAECPEEKKTEALKTAEAIGDGPAPRLETTKTEAKAEVLDNEDREERPKLVMTGRHRAKRVKTEKPKGKGPKVKPSEEVSTESKEEEPKEEKPKEEKPKEEKPKEEKPKEEKPEEEKPKEDNTTKPDEKPATVNDSKASVVDDDDTNESGLTSTSSRPEAKQPDGVPGFPLNDNHLKATEPSLDDFPVPEDALVWDKTDLIFDCDAFNKWTTSIRDSASTHRSKHIKIKPGKYFYPLGKRSDEATGDSNLDITRNIQFFAWPESDWIFDLRGVTFMIPSPVGEYFDVWTHTAFYVNQVPGFRILGGTVWFDQGEIYSYATITSLKPSGNDDTSIGTLKISDGYNVSTWADELVNASSVGIYDVSAWPRSVRPIGDETNLQYMHDWKLDADSRTATANFGGPAKVKVGMVITRVAGPNMPVTIDSEVQGGLQVYGMTTNGAFFQIGDNNGGKTATYHDCFEVNPPPRPGFGPRYLGPAMQWGNNFPTYNGPSTPPIEFPGSKWQEYGGSEDLAPLESQGPPREN